MHVDTIKKDWAARVVAIFFLLQTIWWISIFVSGLKETSQNYLFAATYGLICIWGAGWGFIISKKWGGFSSVLGRSLIFLSLGLLAQEFGQLVFSYYNVFLHVEVPYPSVADIGFFGTIPFYIYGIWLMARASGARFSLKSLGNQIQAFLIPAVILTASYLFFLKDYTFDYSHPLQIFLDFGYPLGEAFYVSLAILTYTLSRNLLGGIMKSKVLFIVAAFAAQYTAEFNFLYQNSKGTWINGGYGDYLYFLSYTIMVLGIIQFGHVETQLRSE